MFDLPNQKVFMDSVHGYIYVPKCFVDELIDTNAFQRLRNVDQTGMRMLYPNAKHDRFSHSLGVFHLGCKAVDALLENFSHEDYWNISSNNTRITFWAKNKVLFLAACLLHDIGHAPFSHSMERIVLNNSGSNDGLLSDRLIEKIRTWEDWDEEIKEIEAAPHELIGSMYILDHMEEAVGRVFDSLIAAQYPQTNTVNILYAEHYRYNPIITKDDFRRDMCFIVRMILGLKYQGYEPEKQIRNCFIELLNGGNFDVDKLDYVLRDTQMSGISNTAVDVDRLLSSVCIITKTVYKGREYGARLSGGQVFSKMSGSDEEKGVCLRGCFRGTILLKKQTKVCLKRGSAILSLEADGGSKIRCIETEDDITFNADAEIIQDGDPANGASVKGTRVKFLTNQGRNFFSCTIKNAELSEQDFPFQVCDDERAKVSLQINGFCDIWIRGGFTIGSPITCFGETAVEGRIDELILLKNELRNEPPGKTAYNAFSVGFKKKAINVIANVLEARDYLYLWIYAHHKVIYYANFLVPAVLPYVLKELYNERARLGGLLVEKGLAAAPPGCLAMWQLCYDDIAYLDDAYLWSVMKSYYHNDPGRDPEWSKLCRELLGRRYKLSLYKSLAEYDLLFESFTDREKEGILEYIDQHKREDLPQILDDSVVMAGYLDDEILNALRGRDGLSGLTCMVFARANYKEKIMDANETFIEIYPGKVDTISDIPLLARRVTRSAVKNYYFYLYYETTCPTAEGREREAVLLRDAVKAYFREVCNRSGV